jgi:alkanesulfonate monooxygenase SsuD/methylene tetrahydromethanopterin reductase-like flavin-dependent oxidoreductase (luciferase family)
VLHDRLNVGLMFSFRNPAQWRRPFAEVYADELAVIRRAEALGIDTIWLTEHHFVDDGYSPSVVTIAAAIAAMTERVRIGFNLLLLPLHNAVRVAEDIATADVISGGRLDPGFGQGYAPHEFAGYGIPLSERLSRFVEGLDVLRGLWSQDRFSYEGRHYRIDDARLVPKPVQDPMPLWIGATTPAGVRRAGRLGANLLGVGAAVLQQDYETALREHGHSVADAKILQLHWGHVAATTEEAWDEASPHLHHMMSVYQDFANASGGQGGPQPGQVPPVEDLRKPGQRLMFRPAVGDADAVARVLNHSLGRTPTTHLAMGMLPGMDPRRMTRFVERLVEDVVPRLD